MTTINELIVTDDVNSSGYTSGGVDSSSVYAPTTETVRRWSATDSISDWLGWTVHSGSPGQLNHGIIAFGPDGVVAQSGALRFATPIGTRSVLMASRDQVSGAFQSIVNVSSGLDGEVPSLEIGREYWDQTLLYGKTVILVCNGGTEGNDGNGWLFEQEGFSYQARMVANQTTKSIFWQWGMPSPGCNQAAVNCTPKHDKGTELLYQAGESIDGDGGDVVFRGGFNASGGSTKRGGLKFQFHGGYGAMQTVIEAIEPVHGNRVVALCRGRDSTSTDLPSGVGDLVMHIAPCATVPTTPPASGVTLYLHPSDGKLYAYFPNGNRVPVASP